jgi:hypothetical protein
MKPLGDGGVGRPMDRALEQAFRWIDELHGELALPGVSRGTFMRRPSLTMQRRSIIGSKDGKVLVMHCPLELKEVLLAAEPDVYFETEHYRGYPALLMRPEKADKDRLRARILAAWEMHATPAQRAARAQAGDAGR